MKPHLLRYTIGLVLVLLLWGVTLSSLELLPLHNDEGLHLRRAVEVWNGHPFWNISDGKIINHWLIAAFYPLHAPIFVGRVATLLVSLIGLAAGYALAWRLAGIWGGLLAGILWIASPYLFFFERLALSDAQAGSLVLLALWLALLCAQTGRYRILTGLALGMAVLFKFTAAPYALAVAVVVMFMGKESLRRRSINLTIIALVAAACFVPPLAYLALRGDDFFGIALAWIGGDSPGGGLAVIDNFQRLWAVLTGFGTLAWVVMLLAGLAAAGILAFHQRARALAALLIASVIPFLLMMFLGREVLPRHFVVALPLALVLAGIGFGLLMKWLRDARERQVIAILV
ncbi:MAG: glycosyltransferase family 39 protein, partial [Anaerolineae bacterium]|nr:glycosyltransferase family 39 protein [Anaerolineae bacterium]